MPGTPKKRRKIGSSSSGLRLVHHLGGIDVDHGGRDALHDRRIGQPHLVRRGRHAALLRGEGAERQQRQRQAQATHEAGSLMRNGIGRFPVRIKRYRPPYAPQLKGVGSAQWRPFRPVARLTA